MRTVLSGQTGYCRGYETAAPSSDWTGTLKKGLGRIMSFSPVLWILFFAMLTVIVKILAN